MCAWRPRSPTTCCPTAAVAPSFPSGPPLFCPPSNNQDPKKYARARELLIMDEEIKKARQVLQEDEAALANA